MRALIVEDDEAVLAAVVDAISARQDQYDWAAGLDQARQLFTTGDYGYVLLDLKIPARAQGAFPELQYGLKLLEDIRQTPGKQHTPVIAMTSHHSVAFELSPELHRLGVNVCVSKPFEQGRPLLEAIKQALTRPAAGPSRQRLPKRSRRAASIERLGQELMRHARAAAEHAAATQRRTGTAALLPRPSRADLARSLKLSPSAVTRCFQDEAGRELRYLWESVADLDWIVEQGSQRRGR